MPQRSLRTSLLVVLVGLTAAALLLTGAVGTVTLRQYLLNQLDEQLAVAAELTQSRTAALTDRTQPDNTLRSVVSVTDYLVEIRQADGAIVRLMTNTPFPTQSLLDLANPSESGPQNVTVDSGTRYRVMIINTDGVSVLVGLPLGPITTMVRRVGLTAITTSVLVLVLLSLLAWRLIVRRLRPLDEIAATATALAEGDLDRRVPAPSPDDRAAHTEVGRLSLAINGMLARIQTALAARMRSEQRMREFVADASHELRTPVTSIRGYIQLIRTGVVDVRQRPDVLSRLEDEATRMGSLVTDLLYLARLDADPPTRRETVDLATLALEAVADAQAVEPQRPITTEIAGRCDIVGDADTLRQVLANLLANVRAHTPPGTPTRVTVAEADDEVRVAVSDDGPGMSETAAAHAFDRFWRADTARPATGGAGLGLAIVAEAIRAHNGTVGIDTNPAAGDKSGQGVTVWFTLPRHS